jgi:hypothetical protein
MVLKKTETEFDLSQDAVMGRSGVEMMTSSSRFESCNVRWDEVVDHALVQPSMTPVIQRSGNRQHESTNDVSVHVQLFGAWASVTIERTLNYCRLFVGGVPIDDMQTPIDADSIDIEMILLVAIEGG